MKIQCQNFKRYKAVRKPKCGCIRCNVKYFFSKQKPAARKTRQVELFTK